MEVFLLFVLYSFFGCVLEDGYYLARKRKYVSKRTLISLPLCPVYGVAMLTLGEVNGNTENPLFLFLNGFLAVSAVELAFFIISKELYDIKWWDYSKSKVNLMGGVNLFYSCTWGALNIIFAKTVQPLSRAWLATLPRAVKTVLGVFLAVYLFSDIKKTHLELLKRKRGNDNVIDAKFLYLEDK